MLLLLPQVLISPGTGQIGIIMTLIAKGLFAPRLLHDYGFLKHAWSLFKFQFNNYKCSNSLRTQSTGCLGIFQEAFRAG